MAQKMGDPTGLTPRQKQLLELVLTESYFLDNFYFTGGTALSSFYLHHRESQDMDFFSTHPFDFEKIKRWFKANNEILGYRASHIDEDFGFLMFNLRYHDNSFLKIDFHNYSRIKLKKGFIWHGLEIDGIYEITVNKIDTIATHPRGRDFVDLYFILKKYKYSLNVLISAAAKKFSDVIDPLQLAKNFLKSADYEDLPKIYLPFERQKMVEFYQNLAQSLKSKIFK